MNIGEKIKLIREKNALTQKQLSELTGINRGTIGNYERGARTPNIEILKKIADALKVNINALTSPTEYDKKNIVLLDSGFFTLDQPRIPFDYLSSVANIIKYSDKNFDFSSLTDDEWYSLLKNLSNYTQFELFKINARKKGDIDGNKEE